MQALDEYAPTRTAGLERLTAFLPKAGRDYAARRNYDLGPGRHDAVSTLSPYLRHRLVTEAEVLQAVLARHSAKAAEKFIQEVYWRTYWKGWLEMRPSVWASYRATLRQRLDELATNAGLRRTWEDACLGNTGLVCFDAWAQELQQTGYLHNHARMWFASIWIFTLKLPWELGADFFLRHLLDGDPASNTLSWRWVAGVQTAGKTYLARASNIEKYTEGRFNSDTRALEAVLAGQAPPVEGMPPPERGPAPEQSDFDLSRPSVLLLHSEDMSPSYLLRQGLAPRGTATLEQSAGLTPLHMAPQVPAWKNAALNDACQRSAEHLGPVTHGLQNPDEITAWARDLGAEQIVTPYAPIGPTHDALSQISGIPIVRVLRPYDLSAWPFATAGFFKFKDKIPRLIADINGLHPV